MTTPPSVPPVSDADRYTLVEPGGVSTPYVDVGFPIYGDGSDLEVWVDGDRLLSSDWVLSSASGTPLAQLAQPITDGRITFNVAPSPQTIEVVGNIHPRQVSMPSAAGIARREFNQTVGYILSIAREMWRRLELTGNDPLSFDASGPLSERDAYDDEAKGFRFLQTDDASARPLLFVKLSATSADWSQALNFKGETGAAGPAGSGSVTSVGSGHGLTGGPITTSGTLRIRPAEFGWGLRNKLLNGAMAIDQRNAGAAFTLGVASAKTNYGLDRWYAYLGSAGTGITTQRVAVNTGGVRFAQRLQRAAASGTTSIVNLVQALDNDMTVPLQGQTMSLSFDARAGADFSAASGTLNYSVSSGTGSDESAAAFAGGTWTGQSVVASGSVNLTLGGSLAKTKLAVSVPGSAMQLAVRFWWTPSGTAGAADWVDITNVQLEPGDPAVGDIVFEERQTQLELALCQRWFAKSYSQSVKPGATLTGGQGGITLGSVNGYSSGYVPIVFPAPMRIVPAVKVYDQSGNVDRVARGNISAVWTQNATYGSVVVANDNSAQVRMNINDYYWSLDYTADAEL